MCLLLTRYSRGSRYSEFTSFNARHCGADNSIGKVQSRNIYLYSNLMANNKIQVKNITKLCRKCDQEDYERVITVNSHLADTLLLWTLAIMDKIQIPIYRGLTEYDSRYYGLSLFRTQNDVPKVSAITRVDCGPHLQGYTTQILYYINNFLNNRKLIKKHIYKTYPKTT